VVVGKGATETDFTVWPRQPGLGVRQLTATSLLQTRGQRVWSAATYLSDGDLFDGVYVYGNSRSGVLRAVRRLARLAEQHLTTAPAVGGGLTV
jgi:hypothetical protein